MGRTLQGDHVCPMFGFPRRFRASQCCSESQSAQLGIGIRGCASPPKVEWAPRWVSLGSEGVCGLGVSSSHAADSARSLELVAFGRTWGFSAPYSFVSSSLVEGTQALVPYQFPLRLGVRLSRVHVLVHFRRNSALQGF